MQQTLPAELSAHVFGASFSEEGVLTLLVDSGAFATRVRYALPELGSALATALERPVDRTVVRVRPRSG